MHFTDLQKQAIELLIFNFIVQLFPVITAALLVWIAYVTRHIQLQSSKSSEVAQKVADIKDTLDTVKIGCPDPKPIVPGSTVYRELAIPPPTEPTEKVI